MGCCEKIDMIKDLFDLYHEDDSDMDIIDLCIKIERVVYE